MAQLRTTLFLFAILALGAGTCPSGGGGGGGGGGGDKPKSTCASFSYNDCYEHSECLAVFEGEFCTERQKDCSGYNALANDSQMRAACKLTNCEFTQVGGTCTFDGIPGNPPLWQNIYNPFLTNGATYPSNPAEEAKYIGVTDLNKRLVQATAPELVPSLRTVDVATLKNAFDSTFKITGVGKDAVYTYNNPAYPNDWVVVLYPVSDYNGAFALNDIRRFRLMAMSVFHSVLFEWVGSKQEVEQKMDKLPDGSVIYWVIGGHGANAGKDFDAGSVELGTSKTDPDAKITPSTVFKPETIAKMHPKGLILFDSCSVGGDNSDAAKSVPFAVSKQFNRPVVASRYVLFSDNLVVTSLSPYSEVFFSGFHGSQYLDLDFDESIFMDITSPKGFSFSFAQLLEMLMEDAVPLSGIDNRIKNNIAIRRSIRSIPNGEIGYAILQSTQLLGLGSNLTRLQLAGRVHKWEFNNLAKLQAIQFDGANWVRSNRQEERLVEFFETTQSKNTLTELKFEQIGQAYGDATATAIAKNLPNLKNIQLRNSAIQEAGLRALAAMPNMETIDIQSHGNLLPETVEQVRKDFPKVEIKD